MFTIKVENKLKFISGNLYNEELEDKVKNIVFMNPLPLLNINIHKKFELDLF